MGRRLLLVSDRKLAHRRKLRREYDRQLRGEQHSRHGDAPLHSERGRDQRTQSSADRASTIGGDDQQR